MRGNVSENNFRVAATSLECWSFDPQISLLTIIRSAHNQICYKYPYITTISLVMVGEGSTLSIIRDFFYFISFSASSYDYIM